MNRRAKRSLTTTSLISAAAAVTMAAGITATWTFLPGGEIAAVNDGNLGVVTDRGTVLTCTHSTVKSSAKSGSGLPGQDIGSIEEFVLSGNPDDSDERCRSTPGSILVRVVPENLPWKFHLESYGPATGLVSATVTGVKARSEGSDGCDVEWTGPDGGPGEVHVKYDNADGSVTAFPDDFSLVASSFNGVPPCDPSLIQLGDKLAVAGRWLVEPKQTVTSP